MDRIPTGSALFDRLLDGGYERDALTTVYGPPGCGKTMLCMLAAAHAVGMKRKVDVEKWTALADLYEPIVDVLPRGELLTCVAAGDLELLGECTAVDAQAASLALTVMPDAPTAPKNALRAKAGE